MISNEAAQRSSTGTSLVSRTSMFLDSLKTGVITESSAPFEFSRPAPNVVIFGTLMKCIRSHAGAKGIPA
jgi:hypothetical protein